MCFIQPSYRYVPGNNGVVGMTPTEFIIMATILDADPQHTLSVAQIAEQMRLSVWLTILPHSDSHRSPNTYDFSPFLERLLAYLEVRKNG